MGSLDRCASIEDLRKAARRRLPRSVFDFIDGGAGDEITLGQNTSSFAGWRLLPRTMRKVGGRSAAADILGAPSALPLIVSPTGLAGFFHRDGEIGLAQAAAAAGVPFCLSANSISSIEDVAAALPQSERWFQIYFLKDRALMADMVQRAAGQGYRVLCITVDLPLAGRRDRDLRNGFTMPLRPTAANLLDMLARPAWLWGVARTRLRFGNFPTSPDGFTSVAQHVASLFDADVDWSEVACLRETWKGPVVVKGILHPQDAVEAASLGADAVAVSNHGGRQLDRVPAPLEALPAIVEAVAGRCAIFLDGGIRRAVDIVTALALGADACMIGRPAAWGLAAGGREGVERALKIFAEEMDIAMALLGVSSLSDLGRQRVGRAEDRCDPRERPIQA